MNSLFSSRENPIDQLMGNKPQFSFNTAQYKDGAVSRQKWSKSLKRYIGGEWREDISFILIAEAPPWRVTLRGDQFILLISSF